MKRKVRCKHPGCDAEFGSAHGRAVHVSRMHSGNHWNVHGKTKSKTVSMVDAEIGNKRKTEEVVHDILTIDRSKGAFAGISLTEIQVNMPPTFQYCPSCTFPIVLMHRLLASKGINPPPFCPNCTYAVSEHMEKRPEIIKDNEVLV
jgi:hypothetical protein